VSTQNDLTLPSDQPEIIISSVKQVQTGKAAVAAKHQAYTE
jgi:hypothetical protein